MFREHVHQQFVHNQCVEALEVLSLWFKPHCELTLLVRNTMEENSDIIVTKDDFDAVLAAIRHLRGTEQNREGN